MSKCPTTGVEQDDHAIVAEAGTRKAAIDKINKHFNRLHPGKEEVACTTIKGRPLDDYEAYALWQWADKVQWAADEYQKIKREQRRINKVVQSITGCSC